MSDDRKHSELGASISHRWIACPGSVELSRGKEQTDNIHAQAGRVAHHVAEQCLTYGSDADRYLGDMIEVPGAPGVFIEVDDEMVYAVQMFVDYCRTLMVPGAVWWIEKSFSLEKLGRPDMYGTGDFVAYVPDIKHITVADFKYGQGVVVEVKKNPQLRYYGLGTVLELDKSDEVEQVTITIVQPRVSHPDGFIRSETISFLELFEFAGDLLYAARRTDEPGAPLVPGSHCRFCPALAVCPAQREQAQALAQVAFADMPVHQPPAPEALPDEILDDLISKAPILKDWLAALDKEAEHRLRAGRPLTQVKLVEKRATRKWRDTQEAREFLLEEAGLFPEEIVYEPELKSPAQIEKLLPKNHKAKLADLVEKKSSGYKLVLATDPRPALAAAPQEAFAALPPASE